MENKNFIIIGADNLMNSRIETLLAKLGHKENIEVVSVDDSEFENIILENLQQIRLELKPLLLEIPTQTHYEKQRKSETQHWSKEFKRKNK
jgi:vacuolar-type H+-ATPase subunit F/Vma7